jgi:antitoxin (DNA-binding transcriptional repressor) of toxin-antitoxin stability system
MDAAHSVTVRDLRHHGGEVLDRVQRGETITITRDGRPTAELRATPASTVSTPELISRRRQLPPVDPAALRLDIDAAVDQSGDIPSTGRPVGHVDRHTARSDRRGRRPAGGRVHQRGDARRIAGRTLVAASAADRAARQAHLQQAEADFEPLPFDAGTARAFARVAASLRATGRQPKARAFDALIAATAAARGLPPCSPATPLTSTASTISTSALFRPRIADRTCHRPGHADGRPAGRRPSVHSDVSCRPPPA